MWTTLCRVCWFNKQNSVDCLALKFRDWICIRACVCVHSHVICILPFILWLIVDGLNFIDRNQPALQLAELTSKQASVCHVVNACAKLWICKIHILNVSLNKSTHLDFAVSHSFVPRSCLLSLFFFVCFEPLCEYVSFFTWGE